MQDESVAAEVAINGSRKHLKTCSSQASDVRSEVQDPLLGLHHHLARIESLVMDDSNTQKQAHYASTVNILTAAGETSKQWSCTNLQATYIQNVFPILVHDADSYKGARVDSCLAHLAIQTVDNGCAALPLPSTQSITGEFPAV